MTAERKEQGSTRQSILQLLRRNGEMTALAAVRCTQEFLSGALSYAEDTPALPAGADFVRPGLNMYY